MICIEKFLERVFFNELARVTSLEATLMDNGATVNRLMVSLIHWSRNVRADKSSEVGGRSLPPNIRWSSFCTFSCYETIRACWWNSSPNQTKASTESTHVIYWLGYPYVRRALIMWNTCSVRLFHYPRDKSKDLLLFIHDACRGSGRQFA